MDNQYHAWQVYGYKIVSLYTQRVTEQKCQVQAGAVTFDGRRVRYKPIMAIYSPHSRHSLHLPTLHHRSRPSPLPEVLIQDSGAGHIAHIAPLHKRFFAFTHPTTNPQQKTGHAPTYFPLQAFLHRRLPQVTRVARKNKAYAP